MMMELTKKNRIFYQLVKFDSMLVWYDVHHRKHHTIPTVWYGMVHSDVVWYGMVHSDVVWYGMVCSGVACSGMAWCVLVQFGMVWMVHSGVVWYGIVCSGVVWYGVLVWHDKKNMVWCSVLYINEFSFPYLC